MSVSIREQFICGPCPVDYSALLWFGSDLASCSAFATWQYYYCPHCDAAFLHWKRWRFFWARVFTFRREGQELVLDVRAEKRATQLVNEGWDAARFNLLYLVQDFLENRTKPRPHCPNDGCNLPVIAQFADPEVSPTYFAWCVWCQLLLGAVLDKDYGWHTVARFRWQQRKAHFQLVWANKKLASLDLVLEYLKKIPVPRH
jgi:hypothetical protein